MQIPLSQPWFDGAEALAAAKVVESGWLFMGPRVAEFEAQFAAMVGSRNAVAVNSGSSALLVSLLALGIGPGDEILAPDMTFISTASCALFAGATPRFVDIDLKTYGMDPADLERRITPRTRAIVPVHYAGQTAEMREILDVAHRHNLPVLEDAAEAQLSLYGDRCAGTLGTMGIFSFTPSKPMTVGEGGMITTDDDTLADRARRIRNFGDAGKFDWTTLGFNFRMMDIQAAIGLEQLKKVREAVRRRHEIGNAYTDAFRHLPGLVTPYVRCAADTNFQLYTVRLDESAAVTRDAFMRSLAADGVASRLYYPALHRAPVFASLAPGTDADFPNASLFADTALSLPLYPSMCDEEVQYVIAAVERAMHVSVRK